MKKVKYSKRQIELIQDSEFLLQKNDLLLTIENELIQLGKESQENYPQLLKISPPAKLSKGENLNGLPYRVMDFPRIFKQEDVFAIRTLVWWGKQISVTLHLKGEFLKQFRPQLISSFATLKSKDYLFSVDGDEWEHDLDSTAYHLALDMNLKKIQKSFFLKIAKKLPLNKVSKLEEFYFECLSDFKSIFDV